MKYAQERTDRLRSIFVCSLARARHAYNDAKHIARDREVAYNRAKHELQDFDDYLRETGVVENLHVYLPETPLPSE